MAVDSLSSQITMWVGNANRVKLVIEDFFINCDDTKTYKALSYKSYYANRK